jgi:hypothetical protein
MRFPKHHIADQVVGRIMAAAHALNGTRSRQMPAEEPLSETVLPPDIETGYAGEKEALASLPPVEGEQTQQTQQTPAELPGLNESGLDMGAVLSGRDSIDALLKQQG